MGIISVALFGGILEVDQGGEFTTAEFGRTTYNLFSASTPYTVPTMAKNKRPIQVDSDEDEIQEATQFSAHSSDSASNFWDVKRVLKEWNGKYLVEWAGVDEYGKPYPQSWIPKEDCTDALIEDWKATKPQKKGKQRAKSNETSSSRKFCLINKRYNLLTF